LVDTIDTRPPFFWATLTSPGVQVTSRDADVLRLTGFLAVGDHGAVLAVSRDCTSQAHPDSRKRSPNFHTAGIPGLVVGIAAEPIVAEPLLAMFQSPSRSTPATRLRARLLDCFPFGRAHQLSSPREKPAIR